MVWHKAVGNERYLLVQVRPARRAEKLKFRWEKVRISKVALKKRQKGDGIFLIEENRSFIHPSVEEMIITVFNIHLDCVLCGHMPIVPYRCDLYRENECQEKLRVQVAPVQT